MILICKYFSCRFQRDIVKSPPGVVFANHSRQPLGATDFGGSPKWFILRLWWSPGSETEEFNSTGVDVFVVGRWQESLRWDLLNLLCQNTEGIFYSKISIQWFEDYPHIIRVHFHSIFLILQTCSFGNWQVMRACMRLGCQSECLVMVKVSSGSAEDDLPQGSTVDIRLMSASLIIYLCWQVQNVWMSIFASDLWGQTLSMGDILTYYVDLQALPSQETLASLAKLASKNQEAQPRHGILPNHWAYQSDEICRLSIGCPKLWSQLFAGFHLPSKKKHLSIFVIPNTKKTHSSHLKIRVSQKSFFFPNHQFLGDKLLVLAHPPVTGGGSFRLDRSERRFGVW